MMKKRVFAWALALCLALSLPVSALGTDEFSSGQLSGIIARQDGTWLVTDVYNKVVWKVENGRFSRFAGAVGAADVTGEPVGVYRDGKADEAYFMEPWDIAPFLKGYAVSDAAAHVVRYIEDSKVQTLAGTGVSGAASGDSTKASFERPTGLAAGDDGTLYVADALAGSIRAISTKGTVSTVVSGLSEPTGLCWMKGELYVAETGRSRICRVVNGMAQPFAGSSQDAEDEGEFYGGYVDGALQNAKFDHPQGLAAGTDGTLYVADTGNSAIRMIRDGRVYTLHRSSGAPDEAAAPRGLALAGDTLLAADRLAGIVLTIDTAQKQFADVAAGAWYYDAVAEAVRSGIASGTSATTFEPDAPMNRAMFVKMLSGLHLITDGTTVIDGDASFPDVAADAWYGAPVRWAADAGITTGDGGKFMPLRNISRQELAAMLCRYAKAQGLTPAPSAVPTALLESFPDAGDVGAWAVESMRWACENGILRGDEQGRLNPGAQATRAQALTMLRNFTTAFSI